MSVDCLLFRYDSPNTHSKFYYRISSGNFVVFKSKRPFSILAIDNDDQQVNAKVIVKSNGGVIGIPEDQSALR